MRIGWFVDQIHGGGIIFVGIQKGMEELGIDFQIYNPIRPYDCDYLLVFNCITHSVPFEFQDINTIPSDIKFAFIDTSEYGWWTHYPEYASKYYSAFAPHAIQAKTKYSNGHLRLLDFLKNKSYPYFLREFYNNVEYPLMYYPLDYPLYYASIPTIEFPSMEAFKVRPLDIYISWGLSHPTRKDLGRELLSLNSKFNVKVSNGDKISQAEYFYFLENAKLTCSFDGYGSGSFRDTEAIVRCVLLKNKSCIMRRLHLTHDETAIFYSVTEIIQEGKVNDYDFFFPIFYSSDIALIAEQYLSNPEKLYRIYSAGYHHCLQHWTCKATVKYILHILENHDWSQITPEEVRLV